MQPASSRYARSTISLTFRIVCNSGVPCNVPGPHKLSSRPYGARPVVPLRCLPHHDMGVVTCGVLVDFSKEPPHGFARILIVNLCRRHRRPSGVSAATSDMLGNAQVLGDVS